MRSPHIVPLAAYAAQLRVEGAAVPDADPLDGGTDAGIMFLLEKPGPMAARSGFVSRDNDSPTSAAIRRFMHEAGLTREQTAIWNTIPWWNGSIRVTSAERRAGLLALPGLLDLLPNLHTAVLVGRTAAFAAPALSRYRVLASAHPSPQVRAANRALWEAIPLIWRSAAYPEL